MHPSEALIYDVLFVGSLAWCRFERARQCGARPAHWGGATTAIASVPRRRHPMFVAFLFGKAIAARRFVLVCPEGKIRRKGGGTMYKHILIPTDGSLLAGCDQPGPDARQNA